MTEHSSWTVPPGFHISDGSGGSQKPLVVVGTPSDGDVPTYSASGGHYVPAAGFGSLLGSSITADGIATSWAIPDLSSATHVVLRVYSPAPAAPVTLKLSGQSDTLMVGLIDTAVAGIVTVSFPFANQVPALGVGQAYTTGDSINAIRVTVAAGLAGQSLQAVDDNGDPVALPAGARIEWRAG